MSPPESPPLVEQALELAGEVLRAADGGSPELTMQLDAQLRGLLTSIRTGGRPMNPAENAMLAEIRRLNDQTVGLMEHRLRRVAREMDTVSVGRRAVAAYAYAGPR